MMDFSSKLLENAVYEISQLPGIGKRTALRLALHLLKQPPTQTERLAASLVSLVNEITYCKQCHNISDTEICDICANIHRDSSLLCVVEDVRDVMAIENTGQYNGLYHVLGGKISPGNYLCPEQYHGRRYDQFLHLQTVRRLGYYHLYHCPRHIRRGRTRIHR